MKHFDIAVIGLGPAGATLARLLNPSIKTVAIDKKDTQSAFKKPCGGLLAQDAQKALAKFDLTLPKEIMVNPQIFSVRTVDLKSSLTRHYQRFYLNLDRHKFDNWLISLIPKNVTLFKNSLCKKIERKDNLFYITILKQGKEEVISAKHIIGADGADSFVRRTFNPCFKARKYTALQQWFKEEHPEPFYSCVFDPQNTDCYSWSVSKDGYFIFGGAYPVEDSKTRFEDQKKKLSKIGFKFSTPIKTEACMVLRPAGWRQFCTGKDNVFFIGEAAGFISPSSLEGISYAIESATLLSRIFNSGKKNKNTAYRRSSFKIRLKLYLKLFKCPFMYNSFLRKLVMLSKIKSIPLIK